MTSFTRIAVLASVLLTSACMTTVNDQPGSATALVGQEWIVENIAGRGVVDEARATLLFGGDGRVSGDTSCNRYFADYKVIGTKLRFGNAGVTKRACAPAVMDQEQRFLSVFNAVDSYRIDGSGALTLTTRTGEAMTARRASI